MDLTIDTSAVIAVLLNEPTKPRLIEATDNAELIAPASLHWELGNALSALFRHHRLTFEEAVVVLESYTRIPIKLVDVPLENSLVLAAEFGIYAYDAYMLECARRYRTALLTLDGRMRRIAGKAGIEVLEMKE